MIHVFKLDKFRNMFRLSRVRLVGSKSHVEIKADIDQDKIWIKSVEAKKLITGKRVEVPKSHILSNDMKSYITSRGYDSVVNIPPALRTLSQILTFPTTLAYGLRHLYRAPIDQLSVCILGARAEHSLPRVWWKESLIGCDKVKRLTVSHMGPGIRCSPPRFFKDDVVEWEGGGAEVETGAVRRVNIRDIEQGHLPLHLHPKAFKLLLEHDLFVLFNPGFGSRTLADAWSPTLRLLLEARKPVLCTAHGTEDLKRDIQTLERIAQEEDMQDLGDPLEYLLPPHENPFRSSRVIVDDTEEEHCRIVTTNHSIYAFQAK